jgi:hypothetical protein
MVNERQIENNEIMLLTAGSLLPRASALARKAANELAASGLALMDLWQAPQCWVYNKGYKTTRTQPFRTRNAEQE